MIQEYLHEESGTGEETELSWHHFWIWLPYQKITQITSLQSPAHREQHIPELYGYHYATYFPAHPEPCSKPPIETYLPPSQSPKMKKQQPRNLDHSKIKPGSLAKYLIL
jgi:hypothetical protein